MVYRESQSRDCDVYSGGSVCTKDIVSFQCDFSRKCSSSESILHAVPDLQSETA